MEHYIILPQSSRISRQLLGVCFAALMLAGCEREHGVEEKLSGFQWPSLWQEAQTQTESQQHGAMCPAGWWAQFTDAALEPLIERALAQNLDIRAAEARLAETRANERASSANLFPAIDTTLGAQRRSTRSGSNNNTSNLVRGSNVGGSELFQAGFDASWELDVFGRLGSRRDAATATRIASESDRDDARLSLIAELLRNYVELRLNQQQKIISEQNATAQQNTVRIIQARYDEGLESQLQLSRAKSVLASTQSEIPRYDALSRAAAYRIDVLLTQDTGTAARELLAQETAAEIPFAEPTLVLETPLDVIRQRPDIRAAQARLLAASALNNAAIADLYPRLSLSGAFGYASSSVGDLFQKSTEIWSVGGNLLYPLFDFGRLRAAADASDARAEQALIAYESTVRTALQEVETASISYLREHDRRDRLEEAVSASQRAVDVARKQYQEGLLGQLEVMDAERNLFNVQTQLAQSTANVSTQLVALYKALGRQVNIAPVNTQP
jgi:NodT family efflux transporter outer membrane factor (OMF) lipoprotein